MIVESSAFTFQVSHAQGPRAGASDREAQIHESACLCDPFAAAEGAPARTRTILAVFMASAVVLAVLQAAAASQAGADGAGSELAFFLVALGLTAAHVVYSYVSGHVTYRSCLGGMGHQAAVSIAYAVAGFALAGVALGMATDDYAGNRGFVAFVLAAHFVCLGFSALANTFVAMAALTFGNGRTFQYGGGAAKATKRKPPPPASAAAQH